MFDAIVISKHEYFSLCETCLCRYTILDYTMYVLISYFSLHHFN